MILDCHSHRAAPYAEGVICCRPDGFAPVEGQLYSVGIHPWDAAAATAEALDRLEAIGSQPQVVAIGETGADALKGAPMFQQLLAFKAQIQISERLRKPLVIHDVRAHDIIIGLYKELRPTQPWIMHGFRGKPSVAAMLLQAAGEQGGIYFSIGEKFNADTLKTLPGALLLAETDESALSIEEIISAQASAAGLATDAHRARIAANTSTALRLP